ncbi:MAG TPA: sulfite oxidase [Thermomicrobiales bacterium]|nr:sulfite oxidase [Thermomicrobiales bacterium]
MDPHASDRPIEPEFLDDLPAVGDGSGLSHDPLFHIEELQLAFRNRGMPLEALRYPITPTGLHYLLTHFDIPYGDAASWRLSVGGLVRRPLAFSLDDLKARPTVSMPVTMECGGNGRALFEPRSLSQPWLLEAIGTAEWTGTPLRGVLEEAGVADAAVELVFTGIDWGIQGGVVQPYQRSLTGEEAMREEVLLAWGMNGEPLQPQHGAPLRLVVPGWFGMTSVKWLATIEAVAEPFEGYQMINTYRYTQTADDIGDPVTLLRPRALMIPPGIPDFASRLRVVQRGPVTLTGRAWAGRPGVARVEVSADGGATWRDATLEEPVGRHAWRGWSCEWDAAPGDHTLLVRATDGDGNTQPLEQEWNYQGMGNNMVQRVPVRVV